jgi:hypothetical protein
LSDLVIVPAGGNLPCISPRISGHRSAVAIGHVGRYFQGGRIRRYRSGVGRIDVHHVHVQKRSGGLAETTGVTDHDNGIADPHFGGSAGCKGSGAPVPSMSMVRKIRDRFHVSADVLIGPPQLRKGLAADA